MKNWKKTARKHIRFESIPWVRCCYCLLWNFAPFGKTQPKRNTLEKRLNLCMLSRCVWKIIYNPPQAHISMPNASIRFDVRYTSFCSFLNLWVCLDDYAKCVTVFLYTGWFTVYATTDSRSDGLTPLFCVHHDKMWKRRKKIVGAHYFYSIPCCYFHLDAD